MKKEKVCLCDKKYCEHYKSDFDEIIDLKVEIRTRLEYATTSGENLEYAVNSIYDFMTSHDARRDEELKKMIEGMKKPLSEYPKNIQPQYVHGRNSTIVDILSLLFPTNNK